MSQQTSLSSNNAVSIAAILHAMSGILPALGSGSYELQKGDYGPLSIKFKHTITVTKTSKTKGFELKNISTKVKDLLELLVGVGIIADLTTQAFFTASDQYVAVALSPTDLPQGAALSDVMSAPSVDFRKSGHATMGGHDIILESKTAFSMQCKGTSITAPNARMWYHVNNPSNAPFILIIQGTLDLSGCILLSSSESLN